VTRLQLKPREVLQSWDSLFTVGGKIVVDDERDLLHVEATSPNVRRNEDAGFATTELRHNGIALLLRHITVHRRDGYALSVRQNDQCQCHKDCVTY
jgi:hypothetical protein